MNNFKIKLGKCIDCGPNDPLRPVMAKRCVTGPQHYQLYKSVLYAKKTADKKKTKAALNKYENRLTIGRWYNFQINQLPRHCENPDCCEYISPYAPWGARAYVAHIVAKRNFDSVAVHPMNRIFLCIDCHTNYDNWLSSEIERRMPGVVKIAVQRFKIFMHEILPDEISKLQPFLKEVLFAA